MRLPLRSLIMPKAFNSLNRCYSSGGEILRYKSPFVLAQRCFHTSEKIDFWEPNRKGGSRFVKDDQMTDKEHYKRGVKMLIPETKKWWNELKEHWSLDAQKQFYPQEGVVDKYFEFNGPESLDNWVVTSDSDWDGGFSTANCTISPFGSGIFSGELSTRIPKSGQVHIAGYANLKFVPPLKSFKREQLYVFVAYTHLALRIRGDGRTYMINIHPNTMFDTQWLDQHSYVLHTRGGPYWQETFIPFSKFFLHHRGRIHDDQHPIDLQEIKSFSITIMDQNDGPYRLEIDYVGCIRDENHDDTFFYEQYYVPRFSGKN